MGLIEFTSAVLLMSVLAGLLGALTGLGGGVVIVPALALLFHIDIRYAIGASLVSVIATSSGAAVSYVREGFSNVRIGMFLEMATTVGALVGAYLTARISTRAIGIIFDNFATATQNKVCSRVFLLGLRKPKICGIGILLIQSEKTILQSDR